MDWTARQRIELGWERMGIDKSVLTGWSSGWTRRRVLVLIGEPLARKRVTFTNPVTAEKGFAEASQARL